jgi:hypothetical protein
MLILSTHLSLDFPTSYFPLCFPTHTLYVFIRHTYVLHVPPILSTVREKLDFYVRLTLIFESLIRKAVIYE